MNAKVYVITGWRKEKWTNKNPNVNSATLMESLKSDILFTVLYGVVDRVYSNNQSKEMQNCSTQNKTPNIHELAFQVRPVNS
jgi:hypothetical protein